jgi:hypothetical protein
LDTRGTAYRNHTRGGRLVRTPLEPSSRPMIHLVNVDKDDGLDGLVLENLADNTSVTSSNDEDVLGVRVRGHRDVRDHLLVAKRQSTHDRAYKTLATKSARAGSSKRYGNARKLIALGGLDDTVEDEDVSVGLRLKDEDVLEEGLLGVKDLVNSERYKNGRNDDG